MALPLLMIFCDEDLVEPLESLLGQQGLQAQSSERRNLDGAALTSWLVLAGVAVRAAPDTLRALADFLKRDRVQRIEYNGIVIENPRPEDVDDLLSGLRQDGGAPSGTE